MAFQIKKKIINWMVKGLLDGITSEDILIIKSPGVAYFRGKKLNIEAIDRLKTEAESISKSFLWKEILVKGIEREACKNGIERSLDDRDLFLAKGAIFAKDVIKTILYNIKNRL